jgi:acetyl-CoA carboxylase carboxyl transferase subunit alpha
LTAHRLKALGLIDKIVSEPLGGAHRDGKQMAALLKRALADSLRQFSGMKPRELLAARHARLLAYGRFKNTTEES